MKMVAAHWLYISLVFIPLAFLLPVFILGFVFFLIMSAYTYLEQRKETEKRGLVGGK